MDSYQYWREIVASWGSLYFAAIFLAAVTYALWPAKRDCFEEASQIPLIED